ncbi:MAG: bifunctional DNA-formamidopyrimidine glycosylase/DNA-(apurinic or apyrimidinic site) lyase [Phycisphaerales bacterium]
MPELPELEHTRLSLLPIRNKTISSVSIRRADVCEAFSDSGSPLPISPAHLLQNARITSLIRRGKQIALIAADGRTLCIQLGMSGRVLLRPATKTKPQDLPAHTHILWHLADNSSFLFTDPRRFGGLSAYPSQNSLLSLRWSKLGPDALTIRPADLAAACADSHRAIKALLLDQSALAGVGNIYADESLFAARIHPHTLAHKLTPRQLEALANSIRTILARAIQSGGSTLRNYTNAAGTKGQAQLTHAVYARSGQPCTICHRPLKSSRLAQRSTTFCPHCQPLRPHPAP